MIGDFRGSSAMGFTEVLGGLPAMLTSFARIMRRVRVSQPTAAVLVNHTVQSSIWRPVFARAGFPFYGAWPPKFGLGEEGARRAWRGRSIGWPSCCRSKSLFGATPGSMFTTSGTPLSTWRRSNARRRANAWNSPFRRPQ